MIYMLTNTKNGKRYIGKTSQALEKRWYQHCKNAEHGQDTYLYRAIRKYGKESFSVEKLCDGLDEDEILMIEEHSPEYNMTKGGDGGDTSSSEAYQSGMARRDYRGCNNPNYGKRGKDSPNYGKRHSAESIQKMKDSYRGKPKKPVEVDGIKYDSVVGAARALGRSERYIRLHDKLNEWSY